MLAANAKHTKDQARLRQVARDAWEGVLFLQGKLERMEGHLDVGIQWTRESAEYLHASEYLQRRTYQCAVDKLEGLVVQRLFELTKANVSQLGTVINYLLSYTDC